MAKKKSDSPKATSVISLHHAGKRANIPTEELHDFVADEERQHLSVNQRKRGYRGIVC